MRKHGRRSRKDRSSIRQLQDASQASSELFRSLFGPVRPVAAAPKPGRAAKP